MLALAVRFVAPRLHANMVALVTPLARPRAWAAIQVEGKADGVPVRHGEVQPQKLLRHARGGLLPFAATPPFAFVALLARTAATGP
eukprot:8935241-Lingulodinium_polyedra.AAC.1